MTNQIQKLLTVAAAAFLTTGVHGAILYNNSTIDTGNSLSFINGKTIGSEINLGSGVTSALVTNFSFEIYSTLATFAGPNVQIEAYLYANNGSLFNGYASPGTTLYDSGLLALQTPLQSQGLDAVTLNFNLSSTPVSVGSDFTLAVVVTGLAGGDTVGMELFDPASVGQNYGDYWLNSGGGWALLTNSVPTDFGAQFSGTPTPEPSTLCLAGVGAILLTGLMWKRRRQDALKRH